MYRIFYIQPYCSIEIMDREEFLLSLRFEMKTKYNIRN